jgi:hypothetical protein
MGLDRMTGKPDELESMKTLYLCPILCMRLLHVTQSIVASQHECQAACRIRPSSRRAPTAVSIQIHLACRC